jgi:hypothetical protein
MEITAVKVWPSLLRSQVGDSRQETVRVAFDRKIERPAQVDASEMRRRDAKTITSPLRLTPSQQN